LPPDEASTPTVTPAAMAATTTTAAVQNHQRL